MKCLVCFLLYFLPWLSSFSQSQWDGLRQKIISYVAEKPAQIGVALVVDSRDTICVNDACRYPLMSVFKLHQAMAVTRWLRAHGTSLDFPVSLTPADLKPNTYSPLRDCYPQAGVTLPVGRLLTYTLQWSDNNACDILFDRTYSVEQTDSCLHSWGLDHSVEQTDSCLHSWGLDHFSLSVNEDEMHDCPERCYDNWSTPLSVACLLEMLFTHPAFAGGAEEAFVRRQLQECATGRDRLAAPLEGTKALIAHKTGTSDRNARGLWTGINDAAFVSLPDGRHYTLVVLVKDSAASMEETCRYLADISAMVFAAMERNGQ